MTQPLLLLYAGDSLTDETFHPELTRYTQLLDANLPSLEPNYTFSFSNHAHGGWATHEWPSLPGYGYLPTAINTEILNQNANVVTIMLGVNDHTIDSGTTAPRISLADYTTYLGQIIDDIRAVNNGSTWNNEQAKIVLITPPPIVTTYNSNGTTCHDNARLKTYADAVKNVATAKGTGFVDIYTPLWNDVAQSESTYNSKYTIGDGTHLNNAGHSFIYPLIRDAVVNIINSTPPVPYLTAQTTCNIVDIPYLTAQTTCDIISSTVAPLQIKATTSGSTTITSSITIHPTPVLAITAKTKGTGVVSANIVIHPPKWVGVNANTTGRGTVSANVTIAKSIVPVNILADVNGNSSVSAEVTIQMAVALPLNSVSVMGNSLISGNITISNVQQIRYKGTTYRWRISKDMYIWSVDLE